MCINRHTRAIAVDVRPAHLDGWLDCHKQPLLDRQPRDEEDRIIDAGAPFRILFLVHPQTPVIPETSTAAATIRESTLAEDFDACADIDLPAWLTPRETFNLLEGVETARQAEREFPAELLARMEELDDESFAAVFGWIADELSAATDLCEQLYLHR